MPAGFTATQAFITGAGAVSPDTEESGVSLSSHLPAKPWGKLAGSQREAGRSFQCRCPFPKRDISRVLSFPPAYRVTWAPLQAGAHYHALHPQAGTGVPRAGAGIPQAGAGVPQTHPQEVSWAVRASVCSSVAPSRVGLLLGQGANARGPPLHG